MVRMLTRNKVPCRSGFTPNELLVVIGIAGATQETALHLGRDQEEAYFRGPPRQLASLHWLHAPALRGLLCHCNRP